MRHACFVLALISLSPALPAQHEFALGELALERVEKAAPSAAGETVLLARPGGRIWFAGGELWAKQRFWFADLRFDGQHSGMLRLEFFAKGQKRPRISAKLGLLPGLPTRLVFPLSMLDGQTIFCPRRPRQLKGVVSGRRLLPSAIERVSLRLSEGVDAKARLRIERIGLSVEEPQPAPALATPIVDELGQWKARDWPGKTKDVKELLQRLRRARPSRPQSEQEGRSRYGGFRAVSFEASGWFRTAKREGRHWLVDPMGCGFFSVGPTCVAAPGSGPVAGMADLFDWLPPADDPLFGACSGQHRGMRSFSFGRANLIRAFGERWWSSWCDTTRAQLLELGCNTIGNWSDRRFIAVAKLPWVLPLGGFPSTRLRVYRDFPDVFAEEYAERSERYARQLKKHRDDPYLIGYFLRNEPNWAFGRHNLALEMLGAAKRSATRDELVRWLRERHGTPQALAEAWGIELASWDALASQAFDALPERGPAWDELWTFSELMVDRYLRLPSLALRKVDPHHLNLGIRYAWVSSELCYVAAGELFDVFSINSYRERPNAKSIAEITRRTGLPVMIGEFHHGATDRGLPSTGIRGVRDQRERGKAYRYYIEQGAALPSLVGAHHFQWNDQPITGRFDGENYNIGFVDVCLRPYAELAEAVKATHRQLLPVLLGKRAPSTERAVKVRPTCF
ncbi:MAG: hypothetical protein CSA62_06500 [Planctomycetota bacterium]|nr:MAG: hypothetical protein CSA62_06500 [Planctomycetota bacterium]